MDWTAPIDIYCERLGAGLWAEPLNAVSNLAFILAALLVWPRARAAPGGALLCAILFAIGVGSGLFHTVATAWASAADVVPIGLFILTYLYLTNRHILRLGRGMATLATLLFLPYAALLTPILDQTPFLRISNFYWTVPLLLLAYAAGLRRRAPDVARGFVAGAALLAVSITLRSLDQSLCARWPVGTHFVWHLLNAAMLGTMIHVYAAHVLAARGSAR